MSRRHKSVVFTKDGVRVGVKQMKNENYVDKTQSFVVKAWNLGTTKEEQQQSEVFVPIQFFSSLNVVFRGTKTKKRVGFCLG